MKIFLIENEKILLKICSKILLQITLIATFIHFLPQEFFAEIKEIAIVQQFLQYDNTSWLLFTFVIISIFNILIFKQYQDYALKLHNLRLYQHKEALTFSKIVTQKIVLLWTSITVGILLGLHVSPLISPELVITILPVGFIVFLLFSIALISTSKRSLSVTQKGSSIVRHSISDDPIKEKQEDLLNRHSFAKDLYEEIVKIPFSSSFVYCLDAKWGDGKTSVINMLLQECNEKNECIAFKFLPWNYANDQAILKAFYNTLLSNIDRYVFLDRLKETVKKYVQLIEAGISGKTLGISLSTESLSNKSVEELKEIIETHIGKLSSRIVVIIDDIDRLSIEDIFKMFAILKGSAMFENVTYVLVFDHEYVSNLIDSPHLYQGKFGDNTIEINKLKPQKTALYLEKIIQKKIRLPDVATEDLLDMFEKILIPCIGEFPMSKEEKTEFVQILKNYILEDTRKSGNHFTNPRKIKRFLNTLLTSIVPVINEVNLIDFAKLQLLNLHYPSVYNDISENPAFYLGKWSLSSAIIPLDDKKRYITIKDHIERLLRSEGNQSEMILGILKDLFWEVANAYRTSDGYGITDNTAASNEFRVNKRISHPECFYKYFVLRVVEDDIPDEIVENIIRLINLSDNKEFDKTMESVWKIVDDSKVSRNRFLKLLRIYSSLIDQVKIPSLIKNLVKKLPELSDEYPPGDYWNSEYDTAKWLCLHLMDMMDQKSIEPLIIELIQTSTDIRFVTSLPMHIDPSRGGSIDNVYNSVDRKKVSDKAHERLTEYFINSDKNIFSEFPKPRDWVFISYQWQIKWGFEKEGEAKVVDYIKSKLTDKETVTNFVKYRIFETDPRDDKRTFNVKREENLPYIDFLYNKSKEMIKDKTLTKEQSTILNQVITDVENQESSKKNQQ